jgi:hypothetical protein
MNTPKLEFLVDIHELNLDASVYFHTVRSLISLESDIGITKSELIIGEACLLNYLEESDYTQLNSLGIATEDASASDKLRTKASGTKHRHISSSLVQKLKDLEYAKQTMMEVLKYYESEESIPQNEEISKVYEDKTFKGLSDLFKRGSEGVDTRPNHIDIAEIERLLLLVPTAACLEKALDLC